MHKDASATFTDATFLAAVGATAPIEMSSEDAAHPNKYFSHTHYCTFQLRKTIAQKTPWRDAGDSRRQSPREGLQHDWLNFDFFVFFILFIFFWKLSQNLLGHTGRQGCVTYALHCCPGVNYRCPVVCFPGAVPACFSQTVTFLVPICFDLT